MFSCETLKNMGRPGYNSIYRVGSFIVIILPVCMYYSNIIIVE